MTKPRSKKYITPTTDDRPARISVAGHKLRPLAIDVVHDRLWAVRKPRTREYLAVHLAEISYECFHIADQVHENAKSLETGIRQVDTALTKPRMAGKKARERDASR